jgi:hypothetical protein
VSSDLGIKPGRSLTGMVVACQIVRDQSIKSSKSKPGGNAMAGDKLTIKLTEEQQNQIKAATGKSITELNINVAATGTLTDQDLDQLSGGRVRRGE